MSSSSLPPEKQNRVKQFDPLVLDRTVIAIPLLRDIEKDLENIRWVGEQFPGKIEQFNSAIEYNPKFKSQERSGIGGAYEEVLEMLGKASEKARRTSKKAIGEQTIDPPEQTLKQPLSFAELHAAVIRRLLAENNRRNTSESRPIAHIHPARFEVMIDLNLEYPGGRAKAREWVLAHIDDAKKQANVHDDGQRAHTEKENEHSQYVFARLEGRVIQALVDLDLEHAKQQAEEQKITAGKSAVDAMKFRAIYHVWPDFEVSAFINKSVSTVKADAVQKSFSAAGEGITWAVMDSGIQRDHRHFSAYANIDPDSTLHRDFTVDGNDPFDDENGHGTHVAGIIAGEWQSAPDAPVNERPLAISRYLKSETKDVQYVETRLERVSGMAPRCRLVSLRVLDEDGKGSVSNLIAAIEHIQQVNGYGRRLLIHGVNMSVGYDFEPEWFACGQSPLCTEVDRLVKSGVVVVVAAGNTGYGTLKSTIGTSSAGMALTINDPGNADLAITVGATHRDMPHVYGVSYFSSKGPTGDGRLKPDLVAPGEKIISCAAGILKDEGAKGRACDYVETSGTSMAAPHVSGVIAAFLSVRREFIGRPERVKEIFMATATDLRRDRYFQGAGLVDAMRAIQSV